MEIQLQQVTNGCQTQVGVCAVAADSISVAYQTMPGNLPNTYGNFLAIWRNSDMIPWNTPPLATIPVSNNSQSGNVVFSDLSLTGNSYIIGYAVGPVLSGNSNMQQYGNACSTVLLPVGGNINGSTSFNSSGSIMQINSTSITFRYSLPTGLLPQSNGAWAGLWMANNSPSFYSVSPITTTAITINASDGSATISNVPIRRGNTYSIGLFMSAGQKTLACSVAFTV